MKPDGNPFDALVEEAAIAQASRPGLALIRSWRGKDLAGIRGDLHDRFSAAGIEDAESDARFLLDHVLKPTPLAVALVDPARVSWQMIAGLADLAARRLQREPLSHILGDKPFWTLDLKVTRDVLTPRADTETLVATVLDQIADRKSALQIADFGTGSGAILLALLSELPNATGLGIDISESALAVAAENANRNRLADRAAFRVGDWAAGVPDADLDVAVSNPPYIVSEIIDTLQPEVKDFEPRSALDGGKDGLDVYRILLPELHRVLKPGGLMAVEIGFDQADSVTALARAAGFPDAELARDLAGQPRIVFSTRPAG
ncbi:peptide chain release factor N(5)-glutamine methyltransferase [Hyphobacterium sp.]|uniref:peptide chain release factor N(5)-glutamine methyltransferase n=1 Tax=Hyphobacterium sp. TaxID=2004662 RepID=UPI003B51BBA9